MGYRWEVVGSHDVSRWDMWASVMGREDWGMWKRGNVKEWREAGKKFAWVQYRPFLYIFILKPEPLADVTREEGWSADRPAEVLYFLCLHWLAGSAILGLQTLSLWQGGDGHVDLRQRRQKMASQIIKSPLWRSWEGHLAPQWSLSWSVNNRNKLQGLV